MEGISMKRNKEGKVERKKRNYKETFRQKNKHRKRNYKKKMETKRKKKGEVEVEI
jgi:hypothetical protein